MRFRYLGEEPGAWQVEWDMSKEETLPRAVEITLVTGTGARSSSQPALLVPIRATAP